MAYRRGDPSPGNVGQARPILPGYIRFRKTPDFGNSATQCFDFEEALSFLASPVVSDDKGRKGLVASPVYITDPCQLGNGPLKTATLLPHGVAFPSTVFAAGSPTWLAAIAGNMAGVKTAVSAGVTFTPVQTLGSFGVHTTSAINTAQAITIVTENLHDFLAINCAASAATATLLVEVSVDNSNFLQVDSIAAALLNTLQYTTTANVLNGAAQAGSVSGTGVSTIKLNPLSFRIIRITAGAAGAGNTTVLDIGVK